MEKESVLFVQHNERICFRLLCRRIDSEMNVTEDTRDDGRGSRNNVTTTTTTTTTTTVATPRYRARWDGVVKKFAIRANRVLSPSDIEDLITRTRGKPQQQRLDPSTVEVECRLRVAPAFAGSRWRMDRPAHFYYNSRKTLAYKYNAATTAIPADAMAAASSGSSPNGGGDGSRADDGPAADATNASPSPAPMALWAAAAATAAVGIGARQ